jgi:hypothetical protein
MYVLIVGPDGCGKSTIVDALVEWCRSNGAVCATAHFRPAVLGRRQSNVGPTTEPHAQVTRSTLGASAKLAVVFADFVAAWLGSWRTNRRAGYFLLERGWHDMAVDPRRYRLPKSLTPVVLALGRLMPRADLVLVLSGDPVAINHRKPEIGYEEVSRQLEEWRGLAPQLGANILTIDTTSVSIADAIDMASSAMRRIGSRWFRVPLTPARLNLRVCGTAPKPLELYHPMKVRARVLARAGSQLMRSKLAPSAPAPPVDFDALCSLLDASSDSAVCMDSSTGGRLIFRLASPRHGPLVVKVGSRTDQRLEHEADVLNRMAFNSEIHVPTATWSGEWQDHYVLALNEVGSAQKRVPDLDQVVALCTALVNGDHDAGPYVHGDLAPWNILRSPDGLVVLDWEYSFAARRPMLDLAHYIVQQGALLGRISPNAAVRLLCDDGSPGERHLRAVGEDPREAPRFVDEYLRHWTPTGPVIRYHRQMGALLAGTRFMSAVSR